MGLILLLLRRSQQQRNARWRSRSSGVRRIVDHELHFEVATDAYVHFLLAGAGIWNAQNVAQCNRELSNTIK